MQARHTKKSLSTWKSTQQANCVMGEEWGSDMGYAPGTLDIQNKAESFPWLDVKIFCFQFG